MMTQKDFEELLADYESKRNINLAPEQFHTLLTFFPALLVVAADGVIDEEEWVYVKYISRSMAETFIEDYGSEYDLDELKTIFFQDLQYLTDHLDYWRDRFLAGLKFYMMSHDNIKNDVLETMYMFSEASEAGNDEEEVVIEQIKKILEIKD